MSKAGTTIEKEARTVVDGVGRTVILQAKGASLVIRDALNPAQSITLEREEVEILHAFLSVSLKMPHRSDFSEALLEQKRLALLQKGDPHVRLSFKGGFIDFYAPSWDPLLCELALLLPRLKG